MKINKDELNIDKVEKIDCFKNYCIVNGKYLIKNDSTIFLDFYIEWDNNTIKEVVYDDSSFKDMYESIAEKMDSTFRYYLDLHDKIEEMIYPGDAYYTLIINISKIYHLLDLGRFFLDKWFESASGMVRKVIEVDYQKKIIDITKQRDVYFIYNLYQLYKSGIPLTDLCNKFPLYDFEKFGLYTLISIVDKYSESNLSEIKNLVSYVDSTYKVLLEKYKEYQENNQSKFKEEDNYI